MFTLYLAKCFYLKLNVLSISFYLQNHYLFISTRDSSGSLPPLPPLIPAAKASVQDNTDCDQPLNLTTKKHDGIENNERPFDISSIVKSGRLTFKTRDCCNKFD